MTSAVSAEASSEVSSVGATLGVPSAVVGLHVSAATAAHSHLSISAHAAITRRLNNHGRLLLHTTVVELFSLEFLAVRASISWRPILESAPASTHASRASDATNGLTDVTVHLTVLVIRWLVAIVSSTAVVTAVLVIAVTHATVLTVGMAAEVALVVATTATAAIFTASEASAIATAVSTTLAIKAASAAFIRSTTTTGVPAVVGQRLSCKVLKTLSHVVIVATILVVVGSPTATTPSRRVARRAVTSSIATRRSVTIVGVHALLAAIAAFDAVIAARWCNMEVISAAALMHTKVAPAAHATSSWLAHVLRASTEATSFVSASGVATTLVATAIMTSTVVTSTFVTSSAMAAAMVVTTPRVLSAGTLDNLWRVVHALDAVVIAIVSVASTLWSRSTASHASHGAHSTSHSALAAEGWVLMVPGTHTRVIVHAQIIAGVRMAAEPAATWTAPS